VKGSKEKSALWSNFFWPVSRVSETGVRRYEGENWCQSVSSSLGVPNMMAEKVDSTILIN